MSLIDRLSEIQKENGLNDSQMAERLGVTRPMWSMLRSGKVGPGRKVLEGIAKSFPEIDLPLFLRSRVGIPT